MFGVFVLKQVILPSPQTIDTERRKSMTKRGETIDTKVGESIPFTPAPSSFPYERPDQSPSEEESDHEETRVVSGGRTTPYFR